MQRSTMLMALGSALAAGACAVDRPTSAVADPAGLATSPSLAQLAAQGSPTGVLLVQYAPGTEAAARAAVVAGGGTVINHLPAIELLYVRGVPDASAAALRAEAGITGVVRDRRYPATGQTPAWEAAIAGVRPAGTDQSGAPWFWRQWNLRRVLAHAAWRPSAGGAGQTVCILSTGIDPAHQELTGKVDSVRNLITDQSRFASDASPFDYNDRGTEAAGIITSNAAIIASGAPDARLWSFKVASEDGSMVVGDLLLGIVYAAGPFAANVGADVIMVPSGFFWDLADPNDRAMYGLVKAAVAWANYKKSVVVAAAGDYGTNVEKLSPPPYRFVFAPAMIPGVIGVGATGGPADALWYATDYGSVETMDLVAPGADILAPVSGRIGHLPFCDVGAIGCYATNLGGTHAAAALVAAAAAMVESTVQMREGSSIEMTPAAMGACLRRTADRVGSRSTHGAGRLNIVRAIGCSRWG